MASIDEIRVLIRQNVQPAPLAPAGWPGDVSPGEVITSAHINQIRDSVYSWPGDVVATGHQFTGSARIVINPVSVGVAALTVVRLSDGGSAVWLTEDGSVYADKLFGFSGLYLVNPGSGIHFSDGTVQYTAGGGGGGGTSQTPWLQDVDASGHSLANAASLVARRLQSYPQPGDYGLHVRTHDDSNWDWLTDPNGDLISFTGRALNGVRNVLIRAVAGVEALSIYRASDGQEGLRITPEGGIETAAYLAVYNGIDALVDIGMWKQTLQMSSRGYLAWTDTNVWSDGITLALKRTGQNLLIQNPQSGSRGSLILDGLNAYNLFLQAGTISSAAYGWSSVADGTLVAQSRLAIQAYTGYGDVFYIWNVNRGHTLRIDVEGNINTLGSMALQGYISTNHLILYGQSGDHVDALTLYRASDGQRAMTIEGDGGIETAAYVAVYNGINGLIDAGIVDRRLAMSYAGLVSWSADQGWTNLPDVWLHRNGAGSLEILRSGNVRGLLGVDVLYANGINLAGDLTVPGNFTVNGLSVFYGQANHYGPTYVLNSGHLMFYPSPGVEPTTWYRASDGGRVTAVTPEGGIETGAYVAVYNGIDGVVDIGVWKQTLQMSQRGYLAWTDTNFWSDALTITLKRNDSYSLIISDPRNGARKGLIVGDINAFVINAQALSANGGDVSGHRLVAYTSGDFAFLISGNNAGASSWNWMCDVNGVFYSPQNCTFQAGLVIANGLLYANGGVRFGDGTIQYTAATPGGGPGSPQTPWYSDIDAAGHSLNGVNIVSANEYAAYGSLGLGTDGNQVTFKTGDGKTVWVRGGLVVSIT